MQEVAQAWLVFDLTKSSFYLGLDDFLGQLPILLFTVVGGVIADRHDRRRLLLGSQYVQMTTAFTLALLVFTDHVRIWHILALSFTAGFAQALGGPASRWWVPSLFQKNVRRTGSPSTSFKFTRAGLWGPLLSTPRMPGWGGGACSGVNGVSSLVVTAARLPRGVKHRPPPGRKP